MRRGIAYGAMALVCIMADRRPANSQETDTVELPGVVVTADDEVAEPKRRAKRQSMGTATVAARRRPEPAQSVPIGLTVDNGQSLDDRRIVDLETFSREAPNASFTGFGDPRQTFFSIRGVGPVTFPAGHDDTSVVTYVDGVPQPFFGSDLRLLDVGQAEILRGPQGTLFGRNAQAGAINITTRQPTNTFEADAATEFGSKGYYRTEAMMSGPFNPFLAGRIAAEFTGMDGTISNIATGSDTGEAATAAMRASLVAKASDQTKIALSIFGQKDESNPAYNVVRDAPGYPIVSLDPENDAERRILGSGLTITHTMSDMIFTSVTGLNYLDYDLFTNNVEGVAFSRLFGLPIGFFQPNAGTDISDWHEKEFAFNQEFRLSSKPGSEIGWVSGIAFNYSDYSLDYTDFSSFWPVQNGYRDNTYKTTSISAFGEVTAPVARNLEATVGLRYTHDNKDMNATFLGNGFPGTAVSFDQTDSRDYDLLTGRFSLNYALTRNSAVYGTVGRGAKSGGFPRWTNNAALGMLDLPYAESTSWSYEVGSKNRFMDGRGYFNVAAFFNDVKDEHVMAIDAALQSIAINVDTESYGFEIETGFDIGYGFGFVGALGYTHAELKNVDDPVAIAVGAVDGNPVPNAPAWTVSATLQYRESAGWLGLPQAKLFGFGTYQFVDARAVDVGDNFDLDAYHLVNGKLGLEFEKFDIYTFANDLLDERPQLSGGYFGPGAETVYVSPGRIIGAGAKVRF